MSTASIYAEPAFDARLKPTWRMLWHQLRTFHSHDANLRAELLVMRAMSRRWPARRIEGLLQRLIDRDHAPREARQRHTSLARANGRGSAGQCPASHGAKTPAAREQASHLVAARSIVGSTTCASARQPREVIV